MKALHNLYQEHDGKVSDKWSHYLDVYERYFAPFRDRPVALLEIGAQNGGSLEIWAKYFPSASVLVGCDINPDCGKLHFDDTRIKLIVGNANSDEIERQISEVSKEFDIIIDDGSHVSADIIRSFVRYFPRLKPDGLYVAEDMHCSYWQECQGGLYDPFSSMSFFKRLADVMNHEHWGVDRPPDSVFHGISQRYSIKVDDNMAETVASVEFTNSMVILRKQHGVLNKLGPRIIAGKLADVVPQILDLRGAPGFVSNQGANPWAVLGTPPEEEWETLKVGLADRDEQLVGRDRELSRREKDLSDQEAQVRYLTARVAVLESSVSWRVTAPLRYLSVLFGHLLSSESPAALLRRPVEARCILRSALFDDAYYRASYPVPREAWLARLHFLLVGCRLGYNPSPLFDVKYYEDMNPEVRAAGWNPFVHYLRCGWLQGRSPHPLLDPGAYHERHTDWRAGYENPVAHFYRKVLGGAGSAVGQMKVLFDAFGLEPCTGDDGDLEARWLKETIRARLRSRPAVLDRNDYDTWVAWYGTMTPTMRRFMKQEVARMKNPPLISIIMPTYNSNPAWLKEALHSVLDQIYPHWELCIADDASTDLRVPALLRKFAARDPRIKVVFREVNGHIVESSNSALALASGDWVALMDHDDLLSGDALYWVAKCISQHPDVEMIYSDEDKVDEEGKRFSPYFKPDWNVDLFYSHNCFSHLGCYKKTLVDKVGGFRAGYEGSQDYDLALRCMELIPFNHIEHIRRILYHWRVHEDSTSRDAGAKPYAMLAGERALNDHFERKGIAGRVTLTGSGYRASYEVREPAPLVSIIIPVHNGYLLFKKCIESIRGKTIYPNYEIQIVDNGSDEPLLLVYLEHLSREPGVVVIRDYQPFNYSALNNRAVKKARGAYIALVNSDTEVISPEWLTEMVSLASQPGVGAVGACLWYPDDSLQHGGIILGLVGGVAGHSHKGLPRGNPGVLGRANLLQCFSAVTAACLVVKRDRYEAVGGLDQDNLSISYSDVDFCLKLMKHGYRNVWSPFAELYHHESASRGYEDSPEKRYRLHREAACMKERWGDRLLNDPAYNPNLTLEHEDFGLAWPPRVDWL